MPSALAFRYARALADLAMRPGAEANPEAAMAELDSFVKALNLSRDLRNALSSPAVPPARKQAVVGDLAKRMPMSGLVTRFILVVINHRRTPLLHEIREALEAVVDERRGVVRVDVLSARPLSEKQRAEIVAGFTSVTGKQVRAQFSTREDLVGGVMARVGSTVLDGSVRGQLEGLKRRLAGAGA